MTPWLRPRNESEEDRAFGHINRHCYRARAAAWIINPLAAAEVLLFPSTATSTNVKAMKALSRVGSTCCVAVLSFGSFCQAQTNSSANRIVDLNTPRSFPSITSPQQWEARATEIRQQVLVSCGLWPMPEKTPLKAKISDRIDRDGYSIEKVYFETWPGLFLAGNLYRPLGRGNGPFPAILNPHGHWANGRMADTKDGSIAGRCISFARQGMIAFSYDMVGYNDDSFLPTLHRPGNPSRTSTTRSPPTKPTCSGTSA